MTKGHAWCRFLLFVVATTTTTTAPTATTTTEAPSGSLSPSCKGELYGLQFDFSKLAVKGGYTKQLQNSRSVLAWNFCMPFDTKARGCLGENEPVNGLVVPPHSDSKACQVLSSSTSPPVLSPLMGGTSISPARIGVTITYHSDINCTKKGVASGPSSLAIQIPCNRNDTMIPAQVTAATVPSNGWCGAYTVTMPSAVGCDSSPPTPAPADDGKSEWEVWEMALLAGVVAVLLLCVLVVVMMRKRRRRDRRLQTESLLDGYLIGNLEDESDDFLMVGS